MKKNFFLFILLFSCLLVGLVNSCKKDSSINHPPTNIGTATSFTEEFDNVYNIQTKGWVIKDNSAVGISSIDAAWGQGINGSDKAGTWSGFSAYSYTTYQDEFAYSSASYSTTNYTVSSWLISPVLSVKNGDKISFYSRADTTGVYTDRMQVLMNKSASPNVGGTINSVGDFTTALFDINAAQAAGGYPTIWTKYEYTFSGISGKIDTRIGFRHYVTNTTNAKGIGIDLFRFESN
jgi:hypothetical protein